MKEMPRIKIEPFPLIGPEWHYIPPGLVVRTEAVLITRLISTRGGNAARWMAGEKAKQALNQSPYCPVIRAIVNEFSWYPPQTSDAPICLNDPHEVGEEEVYQLGSGVINWKARVLRPLEDHLREMVVSVWNKVREHDTVNYQGHLDVRIYSEPINVEMIPYAGCGFRRLYNHFVYPVDRWVHRVVDGVSVALVVPADNRIVITSPDHFTQDRVIVVRKGWILILSHPIPSHHNGSD